MNIALQFKIITFSRAIEIAKDVIALLEKPQSAEYFKILFKLTIICKNNIRIISNTIIENTTHQCRKHNHKELTQYFLVDEFKDNNKTTWLWSKDKGVTKRVYLSMNRDYMKFAEKSK